jgi:Ca2+:H+ antiporter
MSLKWLLGFLPVALVLKAMGANPIVVFATSALAIVPLAGLMGDATEALAKFLGPTLGGLLNASLGNAPEIIIGLFALQKGLISVVKSSLTGSILGNLLLGLGLSMMAGGVRYRSQKFDPEVARLNGGLLTLAAFGLMIPAIYHLSPAAEQLYGRGISLEIAGLLFVVYLASLVFTLVTNKPIVGKAGVEAEREAIGAAPEETEADIVAWGRTKAVVILAAVTIGLAIMSEVLTGAIDPAASDLGLTPRFAGVFLLAVVGNAAEIFNAVRFARKNKMDLTIGVTVGASTQVALLVAPVLVFAGYFMGPKMDLIFSPFEMWAVVMAVYFTRNHIYDGTSNWLEGLMLVVIYIMLGIGFFYLPK